jgi:hypothetical protein
MLSNESYKEYLLLNEMQLSELQLYAFQNFYAIYFRVYQEH